MPRMHQNEMRAVRPISQGQHLRVPCETIRHRFVLCTSPHVHVRHVYKLMKALRVISIVLGVHVRCCRCCSTICERRGGLLGHAWPAEQHDRTTSSPTCNMSNMVVKQIASPWVGQRLGMHGDVCSKCRMRRWSQKGSLARSLDTHDMRHDHVPLVVFPGKHALNWGTSFDLIDDQASQRRGRRDLQVVAGTCGAVHRASSRCVALSLVAHACFLDAKACARQKDPKTSR